MTATTTDAPAVALAAWRPAVIEVPVGSEGYVALVDAADFWLVKGFNWRLLVGHRGKLYAHAKIAGKATYMHRVIAGTAPGLETDHVNGNGLDNRRVNLRPATRSQNSANSGKPRRPDGATHTSRYKGVSWDKARGKWQAKISRNGRSTNLGRFTSEAEAAQAYDAAALEQWGSFARVNFPAGVTS